MLREPCAARPLRVMVSLPGRGRATNPYLLQLIDAIGQRPDEVEIVYFSWRRAVLGRYDVLHVHWPERLARGSTGVRTFARRVRLLALLLRLRFTPVAVVRTLHNLASHEAGDPAERCLLAALDARTTMWIRLNPFTPVPLGSSHRTIVHGHYRDWFAGYPSRVPVAGRALFFGLLRAYKGIEELLAAFTSSTDRGSSLRIAGNAQDPSLQAAVEQAAMADRRISARIGHLPDEELAMEVLAAQLVVLPYRAVHNSGAAILALSLGRPVLMPRADTTDWLQDEVGSDWLLIYDPPLSAADLEAALERTRVLPTEPPDLVRRDWAPIGAQHIDAFRAAVAARRG